MEVNIIRPFVGRALQAFYKHDNPEKIPDVDRASSAQTRAANNEPRVCSCFLFVFGFSNGYKTVRILQRFCKDFLFFGY